MNEVSDFDFLDTQTLAKVTQTLKRFVNFDQLLSLATGSAAQ